MGETQTVAKASQNCVRHGVQRQGKGALVEAEIEENVP